jgi:hypothetical protein
VLRLSQSLIASHRYAITFNPGLKNQSGLTRNLEPLLFTATSVTHTFDEVVPLAVKTSDHSVEFKGVFNHQHHAHLLIMNGDDDFRMINSVDSLAVRPLEIHYHRFYAQGLAPQRPYRFYILSEGVNGQMVSFKGTFQTLEPDLLRISEIMNHPFALDGHSSGEYLEIVNLGPSGVLPALSLVIEDPATLKISHCNLKAAKPWPMIKEHEHVLIVGKDFNPSLYKLDDGVTIIRLGQKTICPGFSSDKKKIIDLADSNGNFIDRYGGYKWRTIQGQSIHRLDPMGLDEERNYCYSERRTGPTPGKINGPCA